MHPRRSRLEVGPTGVIFVLITAASITTAIYTQANLIFLAVGLLLGGLMTSIVWVWIGMRGITLERLDTMHAVAGEELVLRYQINKHSRIPAFNLILTETWGRGLRGYKRRGPLAEHPPRLLERPTGWVVHLSRSGRCQAQTSCWPTRRGPLELNQIEVQCTFPFGIIRRVLIFESPQEVMVLPRLRRIARQVMSAVTRLDAGGFHQLDKAGGSEEFYSLRQYHKGDSLKIIDWKHTARTGKLLSRELTSPVPPTLLILLDLQAYAMCEPGELAPARDEDDELCIDRAIALTASLVCDAYMAGYRVGLTANGVECQTLKPHHSLPHRTTALEMLAQLEAGTAAVTSRQTSEAPSVVIRPGTGPGQAERSGRHGVVLYGDDFEKLTHYIDPKQLLGLREFNRARHQTPRRAYAHT